MMLLPPPPDTCPACGVKHAPTEPHNAQSLYYQYRFFQLRGRWPTWADAVAHCDARTKDLWTRELRKLNAWTEPEGDPIADPPAETIHQPVGDHNSRSFGPEEP